MADSEAKGTGIGAYCKDLILQGLTNDQILQEVKALFPEAQTKATSLNFYRRQLKEQGKLTPEAQAAGPIGGGQVGGARPNTANKKEKMAEDRASRKVSSSVAIEAAHEGETPVEFMLRLMRTEPPAKPDSMTEWDYTRLVKEHNEMRADMAKSAAPYVHPKLAAVEHSGAVDTRHEDALKELE
jgi:hypothetical protein